MAVPVTRLERSLVLLREVSRLRLLCARRAFSPHPMALTIAVARLAQHDRDALLRVDPRQLSIFDAMTNNVRAPPG